MMGSVCSWALRAGPKGISVSRLMRFCGTRSGCDREMMPDQLPATCRGKKPFSGVWLRLETQRTDSATKSRCYCARCDGLAAVSHRQACMHDRADARKRGC